MIRLEGGDHLPTESKGAVPPILIGDLLLDVPGIPVQIGYQATLANRCGIDNNDSTLSLSGGDIKETLDRIPSTGTVQIDDEWMSYVGFTHDPPQLIISQRGAFGTDAAEHEQGAAVYFIETRVIYVFGWVPPGLSFPSDAVVGVRINDASEIPAYTINYQDTRIVDGHRFLTVEFDESRSWHVQRPPPAPSRIVYNEDTTAATPTNDSLARPSTQVLRSGGSGSSSSSVRSTSPVGSSVSKSNSAAMSDPTNRILVPSLPPPAPPPPPLNTPAARAPVEPVRLIRLFQSPLGGVTIDVRGIADTPDGRYSGTGFAQLTVPAHIVRMLLEVSFDESDVGHYHEASWEATATHQQSYGLFWRMRWHGDSFESFRANAQVCGMADLYVDEDGKWRYESRAILPPVAATLTVREIAQEPTINWTPVNEVITALDVTWGEETQSGSFTINNPAMSDRYKENKQPLALPYATSEESARILAQHVLSQRDQPRISTSVQVMHPLMLLTLRDRVLIDVDLLNIYGRKRIPFEVWGVTDRGDQRVLALVEGDPLAISVPLYGSIVNSDTLGVVLYGALTSTDDVLTTVQALLPGDAATW